MEDESLGNDLLTAKELATMFGMSVPTLYRQLKDGPPQIRSAGKSVDIRMIPDRFIGGRRYWSRSKARLLLTQSQGL